VTGQLRAVVMAMVLDFSSVKTIDDLTMCTTNVHGAPISKNTSVSCLATGLRKPYCKTCM
jgi:hypothetical protein